MALPPSHIRLSFWGDKARGPPGDIGRCLGRLVIGYRLFGFLLGDVSGGSLVDRIRAPLGLLVAAGLVAGYHFALWRRDHRLMAAAPPAMIRTIDYVTLVTGSYPEALSQAI